MINPTNSSTRSVVLAALLLVLAMLAVFGQVYGHGFLMWDDEQQVVHNPRLNPLTWRGVGQFWTRPYWGLYIPVSYTFFAAEVSIARQAPDETGCTFDPAVFHLGNVVLHIGCVLLVFVILRRLFRHDGAACAGAMLFGLHPVQVESVAWISEARGVLCALFSLLAIWQYLRYDTALDCRRRLQSPVTGDDSSPATGEDSSATGVASYITSYIVATVAFMLALLSKPAAVAVPLIIGVLLLGLLRRPAVRLWWGLCPWLLLAAVFAVLTKFQQPDKALQCVPLLWSRPVVAGDALTFYSYKLVAPVQLGPDYGRTPAWVLSQWWSYAAWLLPAVLLAALACLPNRRTWLVAAGIFIAWLAPVLGLAPFDFQRISTVADRYLYLALLGPALALSWFLSVRWNRPTVAATATVLCMLGVLSFLQTKCWKDNAALLDQALWANPKSMVARQHRGLLFARQGRHDRAIPCYRDAVADYPQHQLLHLELACSLEALQQTDEALEVLRAALRQNPRWPWVHCKLAEVLEAQDELKEAEEHYRAAFEIDPNFIQPYLSLAKILSSRGETGEAVELYRKALEANPYHVEAVEVHDNLGQALEALGRRREAADHYRAALSIRPSETVAHFNLANVLGDQGQIDEAIDHYRKALKFEPGYARAHVNLGTALSRQGNIPEAIRHYRAALRIDSGLAEAWVNLAFALDAQDRHKEAEQAFRSGRRLVPEGSAWARRIDEILRKYENH